MAVTLQDLLSSNQTSLDALNQSLIRLNQLRGQGLPPGQLNLVLAQINTTQADITTAKMIAAHLNAASTTVQPIMPAEEEQLDQLSQTLDDAITANTIANATLAFIQTVVDDAENIQGLTMQHT